MSVIQPLPDFKQILAMAGEESELTIGEKLYSNLLKETHEREKDYTPVGMYKMSTAFGGIPIHVSSMFPSEVTCSTCNGTGEGGDEATYCPHCIGTGGYTWLGIIGPRPNYRVIQVNMTYTQLVDWHPRKFWPHWPKDVEVPLRKIA